MAVATEKITKEKEAVKELLLKEARFGLDLVEKGISFDPQEIKRIKALTGSESQNDISGRGDSVSFFLPHGNSSSGHLTRWTPYSIEVEDDKAILYDEKTRIGQITFTEGPHPVSKQLLSTGEKVKDILGVGATGGLHVNYSNECALKDLGEDCLFCTINHRTTDEGVRKIIMKTPKQVAEAYDLARQAGVGNHFRITGGFVPERRELEYYIDVAEKIREKYEDFYGVAIIGAPGDLSVLAKYKEAGYANISHNIEVWDKNLFAHICPGKEKRNGGYKHWIESLEAAVEIFGKGNVHSTIVGGLEPKESTLEGIEYFASKGIVCHFSQFRPGKDTPLEQYRSPEAAFHWDLLDKATDIYHRYGFTTLQMYNGPASGNHSASVFRIKGYEFEGDKLTQWKFPVLGK